MILRHISDKALVLGLRAASQGTRILATMVLARFVAKEDYGRFGLILAVPGMIAAVGDFGISRSVTNTNDLHDDEVRDTALVLMVAFALVLGVSAVASGWHLGQQRGDERLAWVGLIVAATFVVQSVQAVQLSLLARDLRFVRWAGVEALTVLATVASGIALAVAGGGIFALAVQQLLAQCLGLAVTLYAKPMQMPRRFSRAVFRRFYSFGWRITLFQYTNNIQTPISNLLIGQAVGPIRADVEVGRYGRAIGVRDLLGHNLVTTFDLVLLPLMARAKDDPERLRGLFVRGGVAVTAFTAFGAAWLAVTAPDLVRIVLGAQWSDVPPIIVNLTPGLAFSGLAYPALILALALGDPLVNFRYAVLNLVGLTIAAPALWFADLKWFALILSLWSAVPAMSALRWGAHSVGLRLRDTTDRYARVLIIAGLVALAMAATARAMTALWPLVKPAGAGGPLWEILEALARLGVCTGLGAAVAWCLLARFDRRSYHEIMGLVFRRGVVPPPPSAA